MTPRLAMKSTATATQGYARLDRKLALLNWLHRLLGYEDTRQLLKDIKQINEGYDETGRSHFSAHLAARSNLLHGPTLDDLQRYDDNIRDHLASINAGRAVPITLRYFQYLAALYTEIYVDWHFNRSEELLGSLNEFVAQHNGNCPPDSRFEPFEQTDLSKLAFWMATGSGKTLLLHLNYRQFIHYNREPLDNILLITPNEGLSQQHLDELQASNIPALRFNVNEAGGLLSQSNTIRVTEITKLVDEKKGGGVSVPVEAFEGNNLIFVDEGHKGTSGEAWRAMRDALAETGFTFEYSATFGQALAAAKNDDLLTEYGKAIAFDYSYRHFYDDGYGKDFHILNLQEVTSQDQTDTLLMANLLSFYEQQLVFAEQSAALRPYNLSRPLWTFVGGSVNAVYQKNNRKRSDVLTVTRFLHRVLTDPAWSTTTIEQLLNGKSGLFNVVSGRDLFSDRFEYLRQPKQNPDTIYRDALRKVMHTDGGGLQLHDLRGCEGEIGLKSAGGEDYFGVIYIGDTSKFKSLAVDDDCGVEVADDVLHSSLFDRINEPDSTIEILAGARKFMEGWNSWRVSNMGLLNIGKSEGSLIIQLFGRGVRLRGRDMSLKRSSAFDDGLHPSNIGLLETLNIFALRADYMGQFRDYLENEGIFTHETLELPLFNLPKDDILDKGLVIPRLDKDREFSTQETMLLQPDANIRPVSVVMSTEVQQIASGQHGIADTDATSGTEQLIPSESLELVDWDSVYLALLEYKDSKRLSNLLVQPERLQPILEAEPRPYRLVAEESIVRPKSFGERQQLQEAVTNILRKYADALYRHHLALWEADNLTYQELDQSDSNFRFNFSESDEAGKYIVKIPIEDNELDEKIQRLIDDFSAICVEDKRALPGIQFDRHLYQPLLIEVDGVTSSPPGLQESERTFVADLSDYCANAPPDFMSSTELFLLRNLSRGKGVGFFDNAGFYPDFILWVKTKDEQRIIFIEPHGMLHQKAYKHDEKAQLHERLPELARKIADRSGNPNVRLDSFIISATRYEDLWKYYDNGKWTREDFAAKHILFRESDEEYNYIEKILHP